jgi:superfamily II DNA or RNA helicase
MFAELYPHQEAAVEAAYERKRPGGSGLWSMPPGTGRTTAAVSFARRYYRSTLLLVHAEGLIEPALGIIQEVWPQAQVGVVTAYEGPSNWGDCRIVVAARDRLNTGFFYSVPREAFRLMIVDDCHLDMVRC